MGYVDSGKGVGRKRQHRTRRGRERGGMEGRAERDGYGTKRDR